jgi:hypothetical protein
MNTDFEGPVCIAVKWTFVQGRMIVGKIQGKPARDDESM